MWWNGSGCSAAGLCKLVEPEVTGSNPGLYR